MFRTYLERQDISLKTYDLKTYFQKALFILISSVSSAFSDPMMPIDYDPKSKTVEQPLVEQQNLQIQAIVIKDGVKIARINQKSFVVGEVIDKYIIEDMSIDKVLLKDQQTGEVFELTLGTSWASDQKQRGK